MLILMFPMGVQVNVQVSCDSFVLITKIPTRITVNKIKKKLEEPSAMMCKVKWLLQIKISTELKMNFSVVVEYQSLNCNYVTLKITMKNTE